MKLFGPTEFMIQRMGSGTAPKDGRAERSHERTRPAISAPPLVLRLKRTSPILTASAPTKAPMVTPAATTRMSDMLTERPAEAGPRRSPRAGPPRGETASAAGDGAVDPRGAGEGREGP